jgi:hypothetical protein
MLRMQHPLSPTDAAILSTSELRTRPWASWAASQQCAITWMCFARWDENAGRGGASVLHMVSPGALSGGRAGEPGEGGEGEACALKHA